MSYKPFIAPPADPISNAQVAIELDHAKVHAGSRFILSQTQVVSTATYKWGITTPAAPVSLHTDFFMDAGSEARFAIIEAPATYSGGSAWPAYNLHRSSVFGHCIPGYRIVRCNCVRRNQDLRTPFRGHRGRRIGSRFQQYRWSLRAYPEARHGLRIRGRDLCGEHSG